MNWRKTYVGEEPQRINKWLAHEGVCSRRDAEALIADGRVRIDGARVDDVGRKIAAGQTLEVERDATRAFTAVLNKPVGLVSAQPERGQVPAARLITSATLYGDERGYVPPAGASLAPLGRLDQDSRGLLLLSEDGVLAKAVIGPASAVDKEYLVVVDGEPDRRALDLLRAGLSLDGRPLKPAEVRRERARTLRFVLVEGRKRQIRRMCEAVGLQVVDLQRVRIGPLPLGALPEGRWRPLAESERAALLAAAKP